MQPLLLQMHLSIVILRNDVHSEHAFQMESSFVRFCNIISGIDTIKEGQVILFRSPEFCLKPLIYMYLLNSSHAPGGVKSFLSKLYMIHWVM